MGRGKHGNHDYQEMGDADVRGKRGGSLFNTKGTKEHEEGHSGAEMKADSEP